MASFAVLQHRGFLRLWLGTHLVVGSGQATRIALLLYVAQSSGSVPDLALLVVMETLPGALAAPLAGVLVDRSEKRALVMAANLGRLALIGLMIAVPAFWMMCVVAACQSVLIVVFQPARAAALPLLVAERDLIHANGLDQSASNLMLILAPVVGAELLLHFGLQAALLVEAILVVISTMLLAGIGPLRPIARSPAESAAAITTDVRDCWRYLADNRLILHLMLLFFIGVLCNSMWMPLAPSLIAELGAPERALGWQLGILGIGSVLGGLSAPMIVGRYGKGRILLFGLFAEGIGMSLYALAPNVSLSTAMIFVWGVIVTIIVVPLYSLLQTCVEARLHGRIFAVVRQIESCAVVVAMPLAGMLNGYIGASMAILAAGVAYAALIAACSLTFQGRVLQGIR